MTLRIGLASLTIGLFGCTTLPLPMSSDGSLNLKADALGALRDESGRYVTIRRLRRAVEQGHRMPSAVNIELVPNTSIGAVLIICSELQPIKHIVTLYSRREGESQSYHCG